MKSHEDVDQRSLALARSIVALIDADLDRKGPAINAGNRLQSALSGQLPP